MTHDRVAQSSSASPAPTSPALRRVAAGDLCSGCGACAAIAPDAVAMALSPQGFLRPVQSAPVSAADDRRIAAACPGLGQTVAADGRTDHPLWGPYLEMWQGHATDPDDRFAGASGGTVTALCRFLVDSGRVDAVISNRPDPDRPAGNVTTVTAAADGPAALREAAGSRYAPAAPVAALTAALALPDRRYAFVGKPCDAVAIQAMRAADPALAARVPVVLSFFCAGTPSLGGGEDVIRALGLDPAEVTGFRYRGMGWPGRATATTRSGDERSMTYHESWGGILADRVQFRCKICADGTGVSADLVAADAWDSDDRGYPVFEEADGQSLIVARTALGAEILEAAVAAGAIARQPFDIDRLAAMQPGQTGRRRALLARLSAVALAGRPRPRYRGLGIAAAARHAPLRWQAKNFLGTLRRILRPRAVPLVGAPAPSGASAADIPPPSGSDSRDMR